MSDIVTPELLVDPELEQFLEACSEGEDKLLNIRLLAEGGATEDIIVWDEEDLIVDGHRRYKACKKLGLPFQVRRKSFTDRQEVKQWMLEQQYCRRNGSDHSKAMAMRAMQDKLQEHGYKAGEATVILSKGSNQSTKTTERQLAYANAFKKLIPEFAAYVEKHDVPRDIVTKAARKDNATQMGWLKIMELKGVDGLRDEWKVHKEVRDTAEAHTAVSTPATRPKQMPVDKPHFTAPVEKPADLPEYPRELVGLQRDKRLDKMLERCIKAYKESKQSTFHLFGDRGLAQPDGELKKKIDRGHLMIAEALDEVRRRFEQGNRS